MTYHEETRRAIAGIADTSAHVPPAPSSYLTATPENASALDKLGPVTQDTAMTASDVNAVFQAERMPLPFHTLYVIMGNCAPAIVGKVQTRYAARKMAAGYLAAVRDLAPSALAATRFELATGSGRYEPVDPHREDTLHGDE